MNKKFALILITILISSIISIGCTEKTDQNGDNSIRSNNSIPIAIIQAPKNAYFGETINFDASESYDIDGEITSYNWDFGDGEIAQGITITHIYKFENEYDVTFPIIYTVLLYIEDNDGSGKVTDYQIKIYPKEYIFYLNHQKLTLEKPSLTKDALKGSINLKEITYTLEKPVTIHKCNWNTTIHLEKPILARVTKLTITLYDSEGNEIATKKENLGFNNVWKEKTSKINGVIDKIVEFESIKITISCFSLRNKINIFYGDEKASQICFNFSI